ncbi:Protein involved in initiation of plasmid replication [Sebaldella termitidis]|uniref:Uncharacterized protein n=1 Tax=Sebaldella termitidis (strain ATCC 33386 / NCTC 11300) TaxID=526218 RepID=D1AQA4_SEBTE|nr:replication initiation protein [Sebaldella termitidis]ACZ10164.1 hypothetical protein Sterm_3324 [Sebaldella termitidis ATCC 33386]SUI25502.1 Protein involved in initiation of plasmid replication [Sebaldella termitidis]
MEAILENIFEKNFENFIVNIDLDRNFSKNEKKFLEILYFNFDSDSLYLFFDTENLKKALNYKDDSQIPVFFEKLMSKKIRYTISENDDILYSGFFSIINSYFHGNNKTGISVSQELKMSFRENNFFSCYNFEKYIFMEEPASLKLYEYINSTAPRDFLSLSLTELKDILGLKDAYVRFFDFEKYILKKIIKDINLFSDIKIEYQRHKSSNTLINFFFTKNENSIYNTSYNLAKKIMKSLKNKIDDPKFITSLISGYIIKKGYDYVCVNASFADTVKDDGNFDYLLKKALMYDSAEFEKNKRENFVLFFEKYELYKNSLVLYNDLYKYLNKILYVTPLLEELYSLDIVTAIRNLRDNEIFEYKNSDLKIIIRYYLNKKSLVQLFFKEKLISSSV